MTAGYMPPLALLTLLFAISVLAVARRHGLRCLALLVWAPAILFASGWLVTAARLPTAPTFILCGIAVLAVQIYSLLGRGRAARQAFGGACAGYAVAVGIALFGTYALGITGITSPILCDLWFAPGTGHLPFHTLAAGGLAFAGAGLIADLAVAVTATVDEVHRVNPRLATAELRAAGMRFGRDVIGTEINSLPLAILGAALGGVLLLLVRPDVTGSPYSWMILTNRQETAVELLALAAGTIALTLTIPLTALLVSRSLGARQSARPTSPAPVARGALALLLVLAVLIAVALAALGRTVYRYPSAAAGSDTRLERGTVLTAHPVFDPRAPRRATPGSEQMQNLDVRLAGGPTVTVENPVTGSPVNDRIPRVGNRVIVRLQQAGTETYAALSELERDGRLLILLAITCTTVVLVAGWQGWRALAALLATLVPIALLLTALVRWHVPPVAATLICSFVATGLLFLILCGWNRKAACAVAGTVAGLAVAGGVAWLFSPWLGLSGRHDSDLLTLGFYSAGRALDFPALLRAAALLGALGVTTDVAMAVASAVGEVHRADPSLDFRRLQAAGLNVGRKVLAAMFGSILFAYAGLNLGVFLLPWAGTGSITQALGNEKVATELFRLLVGGLAIVWAVPATSLVSAWAASRRTPAT